MSIEVKDAFFKDNLSSLSAESIRCYRIAIYQFFAYSQKSFDVIKARDIRGWMASMEEKGLKPRSIKAKLTAIKSFYRYCMEENILKKNPTQTVRPPKIDDSLPYYLSRKQVALLQEHTRNNIRDRVVVEVLYATGVRVSELLQIKIEDIKWDTRQIWVRKAKGNKQRFVLFTHECSERIKQYLKYRKHESEYLFANKNGQPLSIDLIEGRFRQFSKNLWFKVIPHTMRHTFAAHLAEKGMPQSYIQDLLGHDDINSTRIYTRLMEEARKKQYDRYQN